MNHVFPQNSSFLCHPRGIQSCAWKRPEDPTGSSDVQEERHRQDLGMKQKETGRNGSRVTCAWAEESGWKTEVSSCGGHWVEILNLVG